MLSDVEEGYNLMLTRLTPVATLVITSCMIVAVSAFGAEWLLGGNVLCNVLMAC